MSPADTRSRPAHDSRPADEADGPDRIALLLPGQGAQRPGMAHGLYGTEPAFTEAVDEVFALLGAEGDRIRDDWAADAPAVPLDHVSRAQPLLFAVDYALGRMLCEWGLRPAALLGHSAGETAAAVLAGVLDLADAVRLLAERAQLLAEAPPGGMVAVAATPEQVAHRLTDQVVVGAVNSRTQLLLAGPEPELSAVADALRADGLTCARARATTGFHSPSVAPACAAQIPSFEAVTLRPPRIPIVSGYTARPLTDAEATDPVFWAMQPAEPVLFAPALDRLLADGPYHLVETGQSLSALARRHPGVTRGGSRVTALLDARPRGPEHDRAVLRAAARRLAPPRGPRGIDPASR
ncbi:acyltransferase domain-containing protein [Streptomyces sp. TG1A-8]|uniref:acyltransferase domain-containing protein n=1 Tax=Streptomyces sp. TG1A-8 TaxID=3051385 RepID=UPI00265C38C0|nr:acyltransferase domain-containing protein [Streptomyces sp. TG1A-8]MDO0926675.1 acyltransferase domain-containing protein [Streptomyces sp. TG1A-8]